MPGHDLDVGLLVVSEDHQSGCHPIVAVRYERVREVVLITAGINWDGRRQFLGVELANRESRSRWREFLPGLKARGLGGGELLVSDDHAGLVTAIREMLPEAADDCLQELRWM